MPRYHTHSSQGLVSHMCTSPQCLHAHTIVIYLSLQDIHVDTTTTPLPHDAADTPRIWSHQKRPYRPDLPKISTTKEVVKVAEIPHSLQPDVDQDPTITNYKSDSTLQPQKWNSVCTFLHQRPCQRSLIARCASPRDIPRTHKQSRLLNTKISR